MIKRQDTSKTFIGTHVSWDYKHCYIHIFTKVSPHAFEYVCESKCVEGRESVCVCLSVSVFVYLRTFMRTYM